MSSQLTVKEIKVRQLTNQHLMEPAGYIEAVRDLCGVQAQFMPNAMHALKLRSGGFSGEDTSQLVKSWTLRGTVHVFAREDLPLFLHQGRKRQLRPCDTLEGDEYISQARKRQFAALILDSIAAGKNTREELKAICAEHGMTEGEAESVFNPWGGALRALCESGAISHTVQEKKAFQLCPPFEPMEEDAACQELARRYFLHYGPATVKDAAYFFGTTQAEVKRRLARLPVSSVDCQGRTYFYIDSGRDYSGHIPACIFLAGFDPLMLGYQKTESLYLPQEHLRGIFNLAGIVMPAVLLRGRVVGKWKKKGARVAVTAFETLAAPDRKQIEDSASATWPDMKGLEIVQ